MNSLRNQKIAVVGIKGIPKEFPGTSGIETYVEKELQDLSAKNITIAYVRNWANPGKLKFYKKTQLITIPTVNTKYTDAIIYSLIASIHAVTINVDIIWYHGIGPAFFSFIPKLFNKHVYATIHTADWQRKKWGGAGKLFLLFSELITIKFSDKIYVVSQKLQCYIEQKYNIDATLKKYSLPTKTPVSQHIIKNKYDLNRGSYILFLGRFVPEKRIEWLINAYLAIKPKGIKLILAGGSSHSKGYVNKIIKLVNKSDYGLKNIRMTGFVFGREKNELLANCRLFVLPSETEGLPITLIEALSYNSKCLAGDFLKSEKISKTKLIRYFQTNSYKSFSSLLKSLI